MMAPDPLDNNRNWVRAAMGLKYLKEGLESFAENGIINLHTSFLQNIRTSRGLAPTATCSQCTHAPIKPGKCPNQLCDIMTVKIVNNHRFTSIDQNGLAKNDRAPCWKNTDPSKWCSAPWEIAKCFMASGYSGKMSALETDCTGILSVLINCIPLQNALSTVINSPNDIFCKMRETRNKIMHSSNLEVTDAELQQYIDDMIDILNDSKSIQNHPDAVAARTKLNQLKTNTHVISTRDELKLRKEAVEAIETKQKELLDQCQQHQNNLQQKQKEILNQCQQHQNNLQQKQKEILNQCQQQQNDLQQKQKEILDKCEQQNNDLQQNNLNRQDQLLKKQQNDIKQEQKEFLDQSQMTKDDLKLSFNQAITSIAQIAKQCEQKQDEIQSCQSQLNSKVDSLQTQVKQVVEEEKQCQQTQANLQFSQSQLYLSIGKSQSQMEQVVKAVQQCQVDITRIQSVHGAADIHREHVKKLENRQLLQSTLREKYKRYQSTIPLSPILKNMNVDINKVYSKLIMRHDLIHDPLEKEQNEDQINRKETNRAITKYKDIFFHDSVPCKHIFVVGDAGIGKTTWCSKLLNNWLNCETNNEDSVFLQRFEYIFYIQLRHTKKASHINDMIRSYILSEEPCLMDAVDDVLLNEPDQCLVILDGLDEWKLPSEQSIHDNGLPYHRTHYKYTTMITSRPWKLEILRLKPPDIDKAVEIKGLDKKGISKLAGHIVEQLNIICNGNKKATEFFQYIKEKFLPMIDVPLMLTIIVYIWYKNEGFGDTLAGLYGKLIDELLKHAEGDRRRIEQNLEVSKLADIKTIPAIKKAWSNKIMLLPECLKESFCKSYSPLIYALCNLAFNGLVTENRETCLVFTQDSINRYLSDEELKIAMHIGILSQSQTIGQYTDESFSISFLHKTLQEFLAAVYMASVSLNDGDSVSMQSKFIRYCATIENVFEIENVLIFICGMDPILAEKLTMQISKNCTENISLNIFNFFEDGKTVLGYKRLHKLLIRCVREEHLYSRESNHVYIENHFLDFDGDNGGTINYIHQNSTRIQMSLYIDEMTNEIALFRCLDGIHTLDKLCFSDPFEEINYEEFFKLLKYVKNIRLQTLKLHFIPDILGRIDLYRSTQLHTLTMKGEILFENKHVEQISLPNLQTLILQCIHEVDMTQELGVINSSNLPCNLEHLRLKDINESNIHIDLSNSSKLKTIEIKDTLVSEISLPQEGCLQKLTFNKTLYNKLVLVRNINNQLYLELLDLENFMTRDSHIDMSHCSKLKYLRLVSFEVDEMSEYSFTTDDCQDDVELSSISSKLKTKYNISNLLHLESLTLEDIGGLFNHIDLSNSSQLKYIKLTDITVESISLPQEGRLQHLECRGYCSYLIQNINSQLCLEMLDIERFSTTDIHIDLAMFSKLKHLALQYVIGIEISFPEDGCLQEVKLYNIKPPLGISKVLRTNINNQSHLERLTLVDITGSDCCDISNSNRLKYTTIEFVEEEEILLPKDECLQSIMIQCKTHSNRVQGSFTFINQINLESLTLESTAVIDGIVNLSNYAKLKHINMTSIHIKTISLPENGCLKELVLDHIKHNDPDQSILTINFKNQIHLEDLTLEDIAVNCVLVNLTYTAQLTYINMTSIQVRDISLPEDGCLQVLVLNRIKQSDRDQISLTLNFTKQIHLEHLTLDDIAVNCVLVNLSLTAKLKYINMKLIQTEEISLPQDGCLEEIKLSRIAHPAGAHGRLKINVKCQPHLNSLTFEDIIGNLGHIDISIWSKNIWHQNFNNYERNVFKMKSINVEHISLPEDGCLKQIMLNRITYVDPDQSSLILNFTNHMHLERLTLDEIAVNSVLVNLSHAAQLKYITMKLIRTEEIVLPQNGCIEEIKLSRIAHPNQVQGSLILNLTHQKLLKSITLTNIAVNCGFIDLCNNAKLNYISMKSMELTEISLPQKIYLQEVKLEKIIHQQGPQGRFILNMSNQTYVQRLTLENIIGIVDSDYLANNSKLCKLSVQCMKLEDVTLPKHAYLDQVVLRNIEHTHGAQGMLTLNLNTQSRVSHFTLENIQGNVGHIDMSSSSNLKILIMKSIQVDAISLPDDGCLQEIVLDCIKHYDRNQKNLTLKLTNQIHLESLTIDDTAINGGLINLSHNINLKNINMKSLQVQDISLPEGCLQKLVLQNIKHLNQESLTLNLTNQIHLQSLTLEDTTINHGSLNLSHNKTLKYINIKSIQVVNILLPEDGFLRELVVQCIKHADQDSLSLNLTNQINLERLTLNDIVLKGDFIYLSNNAKLKYINVTKTQLKGVSLAQKGCLKEITFTSVTHPCGAQGTFECNVNNQPHLERLTLDEITGNIDHIDMSKSYNMTDCENISYYRSTFTIKYVQVKQVSLPDDRCLRNVEFQNITHPLGKEGKITLNMNNQPYVESLTLQDIIGSIGHMNLSNYLKLTNISITSLQIEELSLPQNGCLCEIKLQNIMHPRGAYCRLNLHINNQPELKRLTLTNIKSNFGQIDLSNSSDLENLSMKLMKIEELTLPNDGYLKEIELKNITHPFGKPLRLSLYIDNQPNLESLTFDDIVGNCGQMNLSQNSKLKTLNLNSLHVENISLPQFGCLQEIKLSNLYQPPGHCGNLIIYINKQQHLERLELCNIPCNIGHMDLSGNSKLKDVTVKTVPLVSITVPRGVQINHI